MPRFPHRQTTTLALTLALTGAALSTGCAKDAINKDARTTFLTANDLVAMTDQMASSIMKDPYLQQRMAQGPLRIVIMPVINETSEIIRDNRRELFVQRLQGLLAKNHALADKFIWIVNREDYEKLRREEIPGADQLPNETAIQPEFALYAKFFTDTKATRNTRSDVYLCQYYLTRISGPGASEILWNGQYETSKRIKNEFLD
jgi:hypothetical protein